MIQSFQQIGAFLKNLNDGKPQDIDFNQKLGQKVRMPVTHRNPTMKILQENQFPKRIFLFGRLDLTFYRVIF